MAAFRLPFFLPKMIPFLVCQFDKATLSNVVRECFDSQFPDIYHKKQIDYVFRYLNDLGAATIVLEFNYVDKDYLDDFSRFYVRRFSGAGHKCARVHFFSKEFNHTDFQSHLTDATTAMSDLPCAELQEHYLGFMVVKPLPKTFIGKTCLKTYSKGKSSERKVLTREYKVNLFGLDLKVESIAFQEQDKVVSACAATAIWSCLHAIETRQVREIPSSSKITSEAINFIAGSSNEFPNKELSNKQILRALDVQGFRHHTDFLGNIKAQDLLLTIQRYIDSKVPLILGATVYSIEADNFLKPVGGHAVAVVGYRRSLTDNVIYLHDDRLGPFAKATLQELSSFQNEDPIKPNFGFTLQEKDDAGQWKPAHELLVPDILIAPTDRKVRIPLAHVENTCQLISEIFTTLNRNKKSDGANETLSYQIELREIGDIKRSFREDASSWTVMPGEILPEETWRQFAFDFATKSLARFQWVAKFFLDDVQAFVMLVDATDIPQGDAISEVIISNVEAATKVLALMDSFGATSQRDESLAGKQQYFLPSFIRKLRPSDAGLSQHLESTYGGLRAPLYLKTAEFEGGEIRKNTEAMTFFESCDDAFDEVYSSIVGGDVVDFLIWVITADGSLMIGKEVQKMGHPSMTGFKPARIAGEIRVEQGKFFVNSKSGRYSKTYSNANQLLENAVKKFESIFWRSRGSIVPEYFGTAGK